MASYTDANVVDSTTYCYRVRAYDATSYSAYSNVACATTAAAINLAVVKMGQGSGTVIGTPPGIPLGINCGRSCSGRYASGAVTTLTATPAAGSTFTGWSGGTCSGTGSCRVTLTANTIVVASFDPGPTFVRPESPGTGRGPITRTLMASTLASGTVVPVTATPASAASGASDGGTLVFNGLCSPPPHTP